MYKTVYKNNILFSEGLLFEDEVFCQECFLKAEKVMYLNKQKLVYELKLSKQATSFENKLSEKESVYESILSKQSEKYENEIHEQNKKILDYESKLKEIQSSNSWKITSPLRKTKRLFKRR